MSTPTTREEFAKKKAREERLKVLLENNNEGGPDGYHWKLRQEQVEKDLLSFIEQEVKIAEEVTAYAILAEMKCEMGANRVRKYIQEKSLSNPN